MALAALLVTASSKSVTELGRGAGRQVSRWEDSTIINCPLIKYIIFDENGK